MSTTTQPTADQFIGRYGPNWDEGLLSEHAYLAEGAGITLRPSASGLRLWAVLPDGLAFPVVCSELIEVPTEDGPIVGRCGRPVASADGSPITADNAIVCAGHPLPGAWANADEEPF